MMDRINTRLRAIMKSRGYGDHSREICVWSARSLGRCANFRAELRRQRMNRHGTIHFLRALWHPLDSRLKDYDMRRGFTRKPQGDEAATRGKNYITPSGLQRLKEEHRFLLTLERPAVTKVVAWAASNGDRSENADYHYGKRRLRQIDGRIRFLTKRIDAAEVVDPESPRTGQAATRA